MGGGLERPPALSGTAPKESVVSDSKLDSVVWSLIWAAVVDEAGDRPGVGVEQQLGRIEPLAVLGPPLTVHPVAMLALTVADAGYEDAPDALGLVQLQVVVGLVLVVVDEREFDTLGAAPGANWVPFSNRCAPRGTDVAGALDLVSDMCCLRLDDSSSGGAGRRVAPATASGYRLPIVPYRCDEQKFCGRQSGSGTVEQAATAAFWVATAAFAGGVGR